MQVVPDPSAKVSSALLSSFVNAVEVVNQRLRIVVHQILEQVFKASLQTVLVQIADQKRHKVYEYPAWNLFLAYCFLEIITNLAWFLLENFD